MMALVNTYLESFVAFMNSGGMIMWILFALNLLLWYGLGQRRLILKRWTFHSVRRLIEKNLEEDTKKRRARGLLIHAIRDALSAAEEAKKIGKNPRYYIDDVLFPYRRNVKKNSVLVRTIVVIAPLIGLLGTVTGMIETFKALETSAMFSQGASISGGISKALFTTELGLIVAVPGLIIGRILDKKEMRFDQEFNQIANILITKDATRED